MKPAAIRWNQVVDPERHVTTNNRKALLDAEAEFTEYVGQRWTSLVRYAVMLGSTRHDAEDLVQTALERCFRHWSKVREANDTDAYVYRVLMNTITSSRRRRWVGERPTDEVPERADNNDQTEAIDSALAVDQALAALNFDQRAAVLMRFYANLTEQQMAAALGVPTGTVKSRLSRALQALSNDTNLADLRGTS